MNIAAISHALHGALPHLQAPSGEPGGAAGARQEAGGVGHAVDTGAAEAGGMSPSGDVSLLTALETNGLQSQLPPSLSDTLGRVATALDLAPADAPPPVAPLAVAPEPAEASHTLQQMAQVTAHVDIAAKRHGKPSDPSPPQTGMTAAPEPHATPSLKDVQLTPAVASMLHVPGTRLRADAAPPSPSWVDQDQGEQGTSQEDEPQEAAGKEEGDVGPPRQVLSTPGITIGADGDLQLYRQIICALHDQRGESDAVECALEELKRQRRVVLATPSGPVAGLRCPAHVDVLWPRRGGGSAVRLAGELLWSQATAQASWLEGHLVKSQGPGSGRQLVPVAGQIDPRRIAVSLGAQAVPMTAWSQVCLRVRDGSRLWRALEPQWSLRVIIGRHALALRAPSPSAQGNGYAV